MNLEIKGKQDNALLGRSEVRAVVSFEGPTPSLAQMRDALVQKLGCMPENMVVKGVSSKFGEKALSLRANVYKDKAQLAKVEPNYILVRNKLAEKKPKKVKAKKAPAAKK